MTKTASGPTKAWLEWDELTFHQKICVRSLRLDWPSDQFRKFEYYVKKDGTIPSTKGGFHRLTDKAALELMKKVSDAPVYHPEKGDLAMWGPGHSFTFIKD